MATVRYLVNDVDASVAFYTERLGFSVRQQFGQAIAILGRGDLTLWVAGPNASAARAIARTRPATSSSCSSRKRSSQSTQESGRATSSSGRRSAGTPSHSSVTAAKSISAPPKT